VKREDTQGKWWMPRLGEAKKDVLETWRKKPSVGSFGQREPFWDYRGDYPGNWGANPKLR